MLGNKNIILIILLFLALNLYSQKIDSNLKNKMIKYLYENHELNDVDIKFLIENSENKNSVLFWTEEITFSCSLKLRAFKFGTSKEHSKVFIMLEKNQNELVILGNDFKKELKEKIFFDFLKFYDDEEIICLYRFVFTNELIPVYQHNMEVNKISNVVFPQVFN